MGVDARRGCYQTTGVLITVPDCFIFKKSAETGAKTMGVSSRMCVTVKAFFFCSKLCQREIVQLMARLDHLEQL